MTSTLVHMPHGQTWVGSDVDAGSLSPSKLYPIHTAATGRSIVFQSAQLSHNDL